jgi:nucleoside-triphosphatase THEP1
VTAGAWALIVCPPGQPKTTAAFDVAAALAARGLRVAGFAQRRLPDAPRRYELCCLAADEPPVPLGRRGGTPGPGEEPFCNCVFKPDAFVEARAWLARDLPGCDVVVIDELSRMEATGGGHTKAALVAVARAPLTVLSIRGDRLSAVMDRLSLGDPVAVLEQGDALEPFVAAVADAALAAHKAGARR